MSDNLARSLGRIPALQELVSKYGPPSQWADAVTTAEASAAAGSQPAAEAEADVCPRCHGEGHWRNNVPFGSPGFGRAVECGSCGGFGRLSVYADQLYVAAEFPFPLAEECTFACFDPARNPETAPALAAARAWAEHARPENWESVPPFLVLSGSVGTGKTHLAIAAGTVVTARCGRIRFWTVPRLLETLRESQRPGYDGPSLKALRERLETIDYLILDDLGADRPTEFAAEQLFLIVDARWQGRMPTLVTSNVEPERIEPRVRSRIMDHRISRVVPCEGKDVRMVGL